MKLDPKTACPLSPALVRLLQSCLDGRSTCDKNLAECLFLSPETVHTEFKLIAQRLDTHDRFEAVMIALAKKELATLGMAAPSDVLDGCVVRQPKAYPVYDADYAVHVETIRRELEARFPTLHLMGRNGMHKYNNQDHAMMTAMLTVENILTGSRAYDVWKVNGDAEYHEGHPGAADDAETCSHEGLRAVPARVRP